MSQTSQDTEQFMKIMAANAAFVRQINAEYEILMKKILIAIINQYKTNPYFEIYLQKDIYFLNICQTYLKDEFYNLFPNINYENNQNYSNSLDFPILYNGEKIMNNLYNAIKQECNIDKNDINQQNNLNQLLNFVKNKIIDNPINNSLLKNNNILNNLNNN